MGGRRGLSLHQGTAPPTVAVAAARAAAAFGVASADVEDVLDAVLPDIDDVGAHDARSGEPLELLTDICDARQANVTDLATSGAVFTPLEAAQEIVALCPPGGGGATWCDPAVGAGAFLLAAAEAEVAAGADPATVADRLFGADIDPDSVAVARVVVGLWSAWRTGRFSDPSAHIVVGDGLTASPALWGRDRGFDRVVGNPPFLGQLKSRTTRSRERASVLRERFGDLAGGYVDDASLFLAAALDLCVPGGSVALVQPESVLGVAHAEALRDRCDSAGALVAVWFGHRDVFPDVAVDTIAVVIERDGEPGPVRLAGRPGAVDAAPPAAGRWAAVAAAHAGIPDVGAAEPSTGSGGAGIRRLDDVAAVTADFRDAYYWLTARVQDGPGPGTRPLVTVGLVDPLTSLHGRRAVRFAKRRIEVPYVDVTPGDAAFDAWLARRSVPKVLVATQTRVVECIVDPTGELVPSTPLLIVAPDPDRIWHVAATLTAPATSARAAHVAAGTGLRAGTIRLRASQLAKLMMPAPGRAWDEAAALCRDAHGTGDRPDMARLGTLMNVAMGIEGDDAAALLDWWLERLPPPPEG